MVDISEIGGLADFTELNAVAEKPDVGVFGYLGADFRQNNTIGSLITKASVGHVYDHGVGVDQAFTDAEIDALPSVYQPFADRFVGTTKEGAAALRSNIDQEMRDKETLGRLGFVASLAVGLPSQIVDPVNYIPMAGMTFKGASLGAKLAKGAAGGVMGAAIQEPLLYSTQETRTFEEMKFNVISSAAFGAVFGGAAHVWELGKARWDTPRATSPAGAGLRPADEIEPLKKEVADHFRAALVDLGYEADTAGHNADITASAYASLAARSGADPKALADTFKSRVIAADAAKDAPALLQSGLAAPRAGVKLSSVGGFETGKPVTFNYSHNKNSATKNMGLPKAGDSFLRDKEPSGKYVSPLDAMPSEKFKGYEYGTITFQNPLVVDLEAGNWKQTLSDAYGLTGKKLSQALINDGYDGIVTVDTVPGGSFASEVVDLQTFNYRKALYQSGNAPGEIEQPLYVVHNLSAEKLRHVTDLGGLAAPSIAIARGDIGFNNFGEISLIGDPSMADPKGKGVRAFSADIYSSRQPRARFKLDKSASRRVLADIIGVSDELGLRGKINSDDLERGGIAAIEGETSVKAMWLKGLGESLPIAYEQIPVPALVAGFERFKSTDWFALAKDADFVAEVTATRRAMVDGRKATNPELAAKIEERAFNPDGTIQDDMVTMVSRSVAAANKAVQEHVPGGAGPVDLYATMKAIDAQMAGREGEFQAWVADRYGDVVASKFFETEAGAKREYTLTNIVKEMTKKVRNGERWNYGGGNLRAAVAPEFKTVAEVKAARGDIVDNVQAEKMKDEVNKALFDLADKFAPYHREGKGFGWTDIFSEFLKDLISGPSKLREWQTSHFEKPAPQELIDEAGAFLESLKTLPTEYFEIKMQRAVGLGEFKAALVPEAASPETIKALSDAGLDIVMYAPNGREAALKSLSDRVFFQPKTDGAAPRGPTSLPIAGLLRSEGGTAIATAARGGSKTDEPVKVSILPDGRVYLVNGYHRIFDAMARGDESIDVSYVDFSTIKTLFEDEKGFIGGSLRLPFFQSDGTAPRGSIEFPAGGVLHGQSIIRLMGGADASTFMHESAHFFLEVMNDLHALGGDKSAFADDIAEIENWAGARGADGKFTRDAHEKFARGFEQYLRSGAAPSPALKRAFEAFKEWLVHLYASAERLNADVSPEMARVYDRLLVPDISEMPGAYPGRSVGAAASGDMALVDPDTGEYRSLTASDFALRNAFARGVEASGVGLTPNNRAARSKVVGVKRLMASMVEDQRDTEASRQGAITTAVETLIKNDRGMVEAKLYSIFGKNGKRINHPSLSPDAFGERVLNALANPDSEGDALVREVADKVYEEVIKPLETDMRKIGMIAERPKWSQDGRYAPHNWSSGRILADLPIFRRKMGQRIAAALGLGYDKQISAAEKAKTNLLREIDQIDRGGLRRRDDMARRFNGDEVNLTEPEIRSLIMQSRNKPDEARPPSLRQFVIKAGGFWMGDPLFDEIAAMEYRAIGFVKRERFQLSAAGDNRGGLPVDQMRERAEAAGYLPENSTINDLINLLDADVRGRNRAYARDDLNEVAAWNAYDEFLDAAAQAGIYFDGKPILRATSDGQKKLMLDVITAMEKMDAAQIDKLREKIKVRDGEISRASQIKNDPAEFDEEVALILDEVQDKLTKQDSIWGEDVSITIDKAGPLKRRSIDVMRNSFSEFMDNSALDSLGRHMHRMIAEYHLTKRFGTADLKHDLASLKAEAKIYADQLTGKDRLQFDEKMKADTAMIQTTRDQLRGTHAKGQTGKIAEASRFMSAASYTLQLGDVVTSSVSDAFRPVMAHGVAHVLRFGVPRLREGIKQAFKELQEGDYLLSDRAGVVAERIGSSRMMSMMDLDDTYHPNTKATRFSGNLAGLATRVSLMDRWNQMGKWMGAGLFMDRLGEMSAHDWDKLRPADQAFLSINRISKLQWPYVAEQITAHGSRDRGVWDMNFAAWADRDLAEVTRAAMRKDIDSLIVTPGVGDKIQTLGGLDFTSPLGKVVLQYKSFWISGHERIMLRAAQNPDIAATASGALMMIVMGMMIGEIKAFTGNSGGSSGDGYDFEKRWADRNFGTMIMGGIDRSGIIPMWMEANNMLERGLRIPLAYRAAGLLGMAAGANNVGDPSSRWASRNALGSFLGPSAGVIQDAAKVFGDSMASLTGSDEGISKSTLTAGKHLIPFQNAPVMRELLNWFVMPAARAALEP